MHINMHKAYSNTGKETTAYFPYGGIVMGKIAFYIHILLRSGILFLKHRKSFLQFRIVSRAVSGSY